MISKETETGVMNKVFLTSTSHVGLAQAGRKAGSEIEIHAAIDFGNCVVNEDASWFNIKRN